VVEWELAVGWDNGAFFGTRRLLWWNRSGFRPACVGRQACLRQAGRGRQACLRQAERGRQACLRQAERGRQAESR